MTEELEAAYERIEELEIAHRAILAENNKLRADLMALRKTLTEVLVVLEEICNPGGRK